MRQTKLTYKFFFPLVSITLTLMLIAPIALKLDHALSYHSDVIECKHKEPHLHSYNYHNHLLDIFFQPLIKYDFGIIHLPQKIYIPKSLFNYLNLVCKYNFNISRVRGPPVSKRIDCF